MKKRKNMVSLWGEHIVVRSFLIGLLISLFLVGLVFVIVHFVSVNNPAITPQNKKDLLYGFGTLAITMGFIINSLWIKPQRNITEE